MLQCATATHKKEETEEIAPTCLRFINAENVGLAQYHLIHHFKENNFPGVTFALGTTQALFLGEFLYSGSRTPSNITIFAFHEQEPISANQQTDFLICHLIQEQGQKKSLNEIMASLKQAVYVPFDFVSLGTQLQLFAAVASSISLALKMSAPTPQTTSTPHQTKQKELLQ
jgi:hypothetical protein